MRCSQGHLGDLMITRVHDFLQLCELEPKLITLLDAIVSLENTDKSFYCANRVWFGPAWWERPHGRGFKSWKQFCESIPLWLRDQLYIEQDRVLRPENLEEFSPYEVKGFRDRLEELIGWHRKPKHPLLSSEEAYKLAYSFLYGSLPDSFGSTDNWFKTISKCKKCKRTGWDVFVPYWVQEYGPRNTPFLGKAVLRQARERIEELDLDTGTEEEVQHG